MKAWMGIDPGSTGAIVTLTEYGAVLVCRLQKATEKDIWEYMNNIAFEYDVFCVKEQVWSMPGEGVSSAFKFGWNNGFLIGLLTACQIPYEEKVPVTWMKYFSMKKEKEEAKTSYKNRLKEKAQQLFPKVGKITNDVADALLISEYCRRVHG